MHLVSRHRQRVVIPEARLDIEFQPGESIWTESSYKYESDQIRQFAEAAGFGASTQWIDREARFALTRFMVEA
jgi:uncharacterized SAM-dependent methyltransferase